MSELELALFKAYTDPVYRQNIQNGTEKLEGLSEDERAAILSLSSDQMIHFGGTPDQWCDRRR